VVKVEEGEVDGNEKIKKNKKDYNVEVVIFFHGRWIGICQKCKKIRKIFSPYNVFQFMFI
jgi:hypothetical protein